MSEIEILEEETTQPVTWQSEVEKLSDEDKREAYKDLVRYSELSHWDNLKDKYQLKLKETEDRIRKEAYSRVKCESTKSKLDMYVELAKFTRILAEDVGNDTLKSYLIDARIRALDTAIIYKVEEGFDIPFHSDLDALKNEASVYNSLDHYMTTCMQYFDIDTKLMQEAKMKEKENEAKGENQPY